MAKNYQNIFPKFQMSGREKYDIRNNFHLCTNFLLFISMFFGLFPLHGLSSLNVGSIAFKWKSWKVFHSIFIMTSGLLVSLGSVHYVCRGVSLHALNNFTFFFRGFLTGVLFLRLAQKWPFFLKKIHSMEMILMSYPPSKNIRKHLKILNFLVLTLGAVEHCLVQLDLIIRAILDQEGNIILGLKQFFLYSYGYVFEIVPYTLVGGIWIHYTNVNLTFSWTFMDMFICSTSLIMASKIFQITSRIRELISQEINSEDQWRIAREDFVEFHEIFNEYNRIFNPLFLLSFFVNIYFLLVQLFGVMKMAITLSGLLYYLISFGLIVIRLTSVCLGGAQINEESKKLSNILVTLPSFFYNDETRRFIFHLKFTPSIISVDGYFHASKGTLLSILGGLVAYEIILIQFDKELLIS